MKFQFLIPSNCTYVDHSSPTQITPSLTAIIIFVKFESVVRERESLSLDIIYGLKLRNDSISEKNRKFDAYYLENLSKNDLQSRQCIISALTRKKRSQTSLLNSGKIKIMMLASKRAEH
jgi:hypothetical protein